MPGPTVDLGRIGWIGADLVRPECVLTTASGSVYTADWRGGVAHRRPDGRSVLYRGQPGGGLELRPNGIALLRDGSFLLAQLGPDDGGVYRLWRDGRVEPWLMAVEGEVLPPTNFVLAGSDGSAWVTVSTRLKPRALDYRPGCCSGFIVRVDARGARVVADGLGYANEVALHPGGEWLYVNETFARRLSRLRRHADGSLGPRETVVEFGPGIYPDGLAFDEAGGAWVVSIVSNRVLRVSPEGRVETWIDDADPQHLDWVEQAWAAGTMGRPHLDQVRSRALRNVSSIAFAGPDRRTAVLGCLLGDRLATFTVPHAGVAPAHWHLP
ncbi:MAG: SMP-30/gluconolactonase/LRE family protein [Rubrivivax sp.]|nr:SMP-30/gluconolactonase/LRE family protein [Rubrivivax sp.]